MGKSKKSNKAKHKKNASGSSKQNVQSTKQVNVQNTQDGTSVKQSMTKSAEQKKKATVPNTTKALKKPQNTGAVAKVRLDEIDIIKAIGIICMVAVHASVQGKENISLFHMAIFFIASGFFFRSKSSDDLKSVESFTIKRWKQLWIPYFIWNAIFTLCNNLFIKCNIYTDNVELSKYVVDGFGDVHSYLGLTAMAKNIAKGVVFLGGTQIGGAFWFLKVLFIISVCYCIVDFVAKKLLKKHAILLQAFVAGILLAIGYYCSIRRWSLYGLEQVATCYWMYFAGFLLAEVKEKYINRAGWQYLVAMVASLCLLIYLSQFGTVSLAKNTYLNPGFLVAASLAGWVFLYSVSYFLKKITVMKSVLCLIGRTTLPVMLLHFLCMKIVAYIVTLYYGIPAFCVAAFPNLYGSTGFWWLAYTAVGVTVPIMLDMLYQKGKMSIKSKKKPKNA